VRYLPFLVQLFERSTSKNVCFVLVEYRNWPWPGIDGGHQNFYQSSMFFNREEETSTNKPSFEGPLEDSLEVNPTLSGRIRENNPSTREQSVSSDGVRATVTTIQKQTPINLGWLLCL
jgi:hypothetical protein